MSMAPSNNGFLLLDGELNLIASNDPALQILCFPSEANRIKQPKVFLADRVRTTLMDHQQDRKAFVREFKSGKRRYICKSFQVDCNGHYSPQPAFAVLLKRDVPRVQHNLLQNCRSAVSRSDAARTGNGRVSAARPDQ